MGPQAVSGQSADPPEWRAEDLCRAYVDLWRSAGPREWTCHGALGAQRRGPAAGAGLGGIPKAIVLAWGPWGLALRPGDLVAGGRKQALDQLVAGLLVLPRGAGLDAQASGPSLVQGFGAVPNGSALEETKWRSGCWPRR
ncbi:hypothetical protein NDU88_005795 [Pleurodeles waltl]|uniref:Uncharacterized protein n=1 Tax=Pleurodeles waltl TaxID=8319 RepID=A0AAV7MDY8_PLEWA|nr:hypothetical protein NDU88_005795 [Pleurodeles waltl]